MYDNIVSWAVTVDWQAWAMFAQAVAILAAAWWAKGSIKDFVSQRRAARKIEIAKTTLRLAYTAQDRVRAYRLSPPVNEMMGVSFNANEDPRLIEIKKINHEIFAEIDHIAPDTTIFFGSELTDTLRTLKVPLTHLFWAASEDASYRYLRRTEGQPSAGEPPTAAKQLAYGDLDDDFDTKLSDVVDRIEKYIARSGIELSA